MSVDLAAITVTIDDCRKAGYCPMGVRSWWPMQAMPIGFNAFLKSGLPADQFIAGGDHLAQLTVERKLEREAAANG